MEQQSESDNIGVWTTELLVLTLPEEMNVQLDGTRAHMMASISVNHQITILDVILLYSPLKD